MATAILTGGSRGLGRALARGLVEQGWSVVLDGRDASALGEVAALLGAGARAIPGDVTDPDHRRALVAAARDMGGVDVLINNAGGLGPSPLPHLRELDVARLTELHEVNVLAPLALTQLALPYLTAAGGAVINVTSDAAVEAYEGWGAYGATKAALDHVSRVLAVEEPQVRVWSFDPGDLRTDMHQAAFPGEDISDRPTPESVVPALLALLASRPPSGRVRAADLLEVESP
jgi:NAD(P)-dependent dehydrogenase (short-subunit alcohol dehydrogenase family)